MKQLKRIVLTSCLLIITVTAAACGGHASGRTGMPQSSPPSAVSSGVASAVSSGPASAVVSTAPKVIDGFVQLKDLDPDFVIDLKYATTDNFTHQKVYPTTVCALRVATAQKLVNANAAFKKLGYRIKVWDAYRPLSVQKIFWGIMPDDNYVANPYTGGSRHNRGCAVDITLVDTGGNELTMPSGFDDFTVSAHRDNPAMSQTARDNMNLLTTVMTQNGFTTIDTEWWHFDDSDWANYPVSDVDLAQFEN